jgi:hypothetical protein
MADLSGVIDNYFTVASETFSDNLSSSISAGATTVPVNNNSEYTNGDCVVLTVDPGTVNEATFIGKKSGLNFIECIWTEGNVAVGHSNGATVIDYDSATHHSAQSKGIQQFANDDGTLKTQPVRDALGLGASAVNGWEVLPYTLAVTSGYNKGNKEFDIVVSNNDLSDELTPGMRLRLQRGTTAPTQCMDLESSSSQYGSKTTSSGLGQTDDITVEAWINPESYVLGGIMTTANGTTNGWNFYLDASGRITFAGARAADDFIVSLQSVNLGIWQHVAANIDSSGATGTIYINGISVVSSFTNNANTAFLATNTNFVIGATNAATPTNFFDGKISDCRIWSVVRTATQIQDNMNNQLVGSETNLVGYWKLNGALTDSTSNANHLTGSGGAVATTLDNPMKDTEYAIITRVSYSAPNTTLTVYTGTDYNIPNMTLSSPYYSVQKSPYGFPTEKDKWTLNFPIYSTINVGGTTANTTYNAGGYFVDIPKGSWDLSYNISYGVTPNAAIPDLYLGLQTSSTAFVDKETDMTNRLITNGAASSNFTLFRGYAIKQITLTAVTRYYILVRNGSNMSSNQIRANTSTTIPEHSSITAVSAYV